MERPYIRIEDTGEVIPLRADVTTVGRGSSVDVRLRDPSVSKLHAEIVCRGNYAYVADLGLSRNGTRVNGRPAARRVLEDGDVLSFGSARCRVGGLVQENIAAEIELRRQAAPELTRRETDVLTSLCRPALSDEAFVAPATAREIAADLVVTEAAVKQHLLRLYQKFRIAEGANRRTRLANEVVALGLVRPLPPPGRAESGGAPAGATPTAGATAGSGLAGSGVAGSGVAGSGLAGSGLAGSGLAGSVAAGGGPASAAQTSAAQTSAAPASAAPASAAPAGGRTAGTTLSGAPAAGGTSPGRPPATEPTLRGPTRARPVPGGPVTRAPPATGVQTAAGAPPASKERAGAERLPDRQAS